MQPGQFRAQRDLLIELDSSGCETGFLLGVLRFSRLPKIQAELGFVLE